MPYTWSDSGNLLDDGVNTYTYDHANRLTMVYEGLSESTYTFAYNGLGDRLGQALSGEWSTQYTLDLAAGLTQVLSDGHNAYLYGVGRIGEQQPDGWQYHLGDALGSVRQLADEGGAATLAQSYQPYGSLLDMEGDAESIYGFTGEQMDWTGLVYLRARYYDTIVGRFLQGDTLGRSSLFPVSYNRHLYARSNPVRYFDPAGRDPIDDMLERLRDETEICFNAGDLQCVWREYYTLAAGGNMLGYTDAARHLFQFLLKRGDIFYPPVGYMEYGVSSYWVQSSQAARNMLPEVELEILAAIHDAAGTSRDAASVTTDPQAVVVDPDVERRFYYAMNSFAMWAEVDYEFDGCEELVIHPDFHFYDAYDWHGELGWMAGGPQAGLAGFKDEWAASLHDNGLALEFEITGYWHGTSKRFVLPPNWLEADIALPPISERAAPLGR